MPWFSNAICVESVVGEPAEPREIRAQMTAGVKKFHALPPPNPGEPVFRRDVRPNVQAAATLFAMRERAWGQNEEETYSKTKAIRR